MPEISERHIVKNLNYLRLPSAFRHTFVVDWQTTPEPVVSIAHTNDHIEVTYRWKTSQLKKRE